MTEQSFSSRVDTTQTDGFTKMPDEVGLHIVRHLSKLPWQERRDTLTNFAQCSSRCRVLASHGLRTHVLYQESNAISWFKDIARAANTLCTTRENDPEHSENDDAERILSRLNDIEHIVVDCNLQNASESMKDAEHALLRLQVSRDRMLFARPHGVSWSAQGILSHSSETNDQRSGSPALLRPTSLFPTLLKGRDIVQSVSDPSRSSFIVTLGNPPELGKAGCEIQQPLLYRRISPQDVCNWLGEDSTQNGRSMNLQDSEKTLLEMLEEGHQSTEEDIDLQLEHIGRFVRSRFTFFDDIVSRKRDFDLVIHSDHELYGILVDEFKETDSGRLGNWDETADMLVRGYGPHFPNQVLSPSQNAALSFLTG